MCLRGGLLACADAVEGNRHSWGFSVESDSQSMMVDPLDQSANKIATGTGGEFQLAHLET